MTIALITKNSIYLFIKKKIFFNCTVACRILIHQSGLKLMPPAMEARRLNHWTIKEVPSYSDF